MVAEAQPLLQAVGEERPIFVVGAHRSGTTLLQALLGAHPRIGAPPEVDFYGRVWVRRDEFGDLADDAALKAVVEFTLNRRTLQEAGFDVASVYPRAFSGVRTYAAVLRVVMTDFAFQHRKLLSCEKTPLLRVSWL